MAALAGSSGALPHVAASLLNTSDSSISMQQDSCLESSLRTPNPVCCRPKRNKVPFSGKILYLPDKHSARAPESKCSGFQNLFLLRGKLILVMQKSQALGIPSVPSQPGQLVTWQMDSTFNTLGWLGRRKFPSVPVEFMRLDLKLMEKKKQILIHAHGRRIE